MHLSLFDEGRLFGWDVAFPFLGRRSCFGSVSCVPSFGLKPFGFALDHFDGESS